MQKTRTQELTELALTAARSAGEKILGIYQTNDFGLTLKVDDSPLTLADRAAHDEIVNKLVKSGIPILSEEGVDIPYDVRKNWEYFWLVDPLDGTKEFVKKNGEFTVNIALIHEGEPIIGVVYAPVLDWMYWGSKGDGAWKLTENCIPEKLSTVSDFTVRNIACSRSHMNLQTEEFISQYPEAELITMGSSLKFMLVAENKAQLYPRFGPTMEWDTAAAHAIVSAMGGKVERIEDKISLKYNKENLLNPDFLVRAH
jgi:3'(2'), 5'-bisphosphate nucleotidase